MRNRYILLADVCLIPIVVWAAFVLRFDLRFYVERHEFLLFVAAALVIKPTVFYFFGMYRRYWRYASIQDLIALLVAVSASSVGMGMFVAGMMIYRPNLYFYSRAVVLLDGLLMFVAAGGARVSVRVLGESRARARQSQRGAPPKRVLVVGAGHAGAMVVREMERNPHLAMMPVGFLDDDAAKVGKQIYGVPVLGTTKWLAEAVRERRIDEVIIAMPTVPGSFIRSITEQCRQIGVVSRTMPGVFELIDGAVSVSRLRAVDITDLLRRSQVQLGANTNNHVTGRLVLVTGAGGSIGFELCRQVAHAKPQAIVLLGHGENSIFEAHANLQHSFPGVNVIPVIADVRNRNRLRKIFGHVRPAVVFHAAAHKHVPLMEDNPEEAVSNNVLGTANVVEAAIEAGVARFVLISTDKAVAPISLMGASKRIAEFVVRDAATRTGRGFVVVRFGNVLGSRGSVVTTFRQQIERGGPITITHPDMTRFFMTIPEAVHLVLQAGGIGRGGELFALKMGDPVRIVDLAQDLIRLSGFAAADIPIVFTGVRPGEKLTEQLWEPGSVVEATVNPEILKITEREAGSPVPIEGIIGALDDAAQRGDRIELEALLATYIPTFSPLIREGFRAGI